MTEDEAKTKGMQASDIPAIQANPEFSRALVGFAFGEELLVTIEKEDPGRTQHYMEVSDFIFSVIYAMTQPGGVALHFQEDSVPLEKEELQVLLLGMKGFDLITMDDDGGIRITEKAVRMVPPMPQRRLDG